MVSVHFSIYELTELMLTAYKFYKMHSHNLGVRNLVALCMINIYSQFNSLPIIKIVQNVFTASIYVV